MSQRTSSSASAVPPAGLERVDRPAASVAGRAAAGCDQDAAGSAPNGRGDQLAGPGAAGPLRVPLGLVHQARDPKRRPPRRSPWILRAPGRSAPRRAVRAGRATGAARRLAAHGVDQHLHRSLASVGGGTEVRLRPRRARAPARSPRRPRGRSACLELRATGIRPLTWQLGVERVDVLLVLLGDDVALDLHASGSARRVSWERSWGRISNFFTCSTRANFSLILSTCAWIDGPHALVAPRARPGRRASPSRCAELGALLRVERDQRDQVGPPVADHDALGDERVLLDLGLEVRRGDVLAARGDDDVLLAAGDRQVAVVVELADVAGVQPAVDERLPRRLLVLVVALEDVRAPDQDLAVVGDLDLAARERAADRAELEVVGPWRSSPRWRSRSSPSPRG